MKGFSHFQGTAVFTAFFNESDDQEVVIHPEGQRKVIYASQNVCFGVG
jgi:hypothetical protein